MGKLSAILLVVLLLLYDHPTIAQSGFYIPQSGKIFFNGDTATIFSNVINYGQFGVGKRAFINFSGKSWENDPQALIVDEGFLRNGIWATGGWIRFLSDSIRQQLNGGYNAAIKRGPTFSRLQIQNKMGVELNFSSTKVRNEFTFSQGLFYLNDYTFTIGNNGPGKINGYDSAKYFVTENKPGGGYLIRENIINTDGRIDFPIGSRDHSYTPAAIQSNTLQGDDYYANVFDSVHANRLTGNYLFSESVNKTWELGKRFQPGMGNVEIFLQHLNADEGSYFSQNKTNSYVAYFNNNHWDTGSPQLYPSSGYLTSGRPLSNSGVNSRIFYNTLGGPSYFTKLTGFGDALLQTGLWFNARRTGYSNVHVYWKTKPEIGVQYFIVQRRLSNEINFSDIDTIASQINGGISLNELDYFMNDPNGYTGISFYRLKVVNLNASFFYSNIVAVGGIPGEPLNLIWPNPTQGIFWVSCDPVWKIESIVIWNSAGQKIREVNTNGRNIIQMDPLAAAGTYFVGLISETGKIVETKKLVVIGK